MKDIIKGGHLRLVRLDAEGNPVGSAFDIDGQLSLRVEDSEGDVEVIPVSGNSVVSGRFRPTTVEFEAGEIPISVLALMMGETWRFNSTYMAMGAEVEFDYTGTRLPFDERLGNCYELAATAFMDYYFNHAGVDKALVMEARGVPVPTTLVHGTWSSPETREHPIAHAWVVLSDGRIWEPISALIFDAEKFYSFCEPHDMETYAEHEVRVNMLKHGHYGRWT